MTLGALIFMLCAWGVVLGILVWSFTKLLRPGGKHEGTPPRSG